MIRLFAVTVLAAATGALVLAAAPGDDEPERTGAPSFRDDFDTLDRRRWNVSDGWANGPYQSCLWRANMVRVRDGVLGVSLGPLAEPAQGRDHACGELQSKAVHHHGTYEARIRFSYASGTTSAFFTYIGPYFGKPHDEIDFEYIGRRPGMLQTNYFVNGKGGPETTTSVPDGHVAFRTYAFRWEPGRLAFYVDGEMVREITEGPLPAEAQKIYFSVWSTDMLTDWLGPFHPLEEPVTMDVDWISFTALGDDCLFEGSLACRF